MDLRRLTFDLLGVRFKSDRNQQAGQGAILEKSREYVIEEVYPYHVVCTSKCENGYVIRESFCANELILLGLLKGRR